MITFARTSQPLNQPDEDSGVHRRRPAGVPPPPDVSGPREEGLALTHTPSGFVAAWSEPPRGCRGAQRSRRLPLGFRGADVGGDPASLLENRTPPRARQEDALLGTATLPRAPSTDTERAARVRENCQTRMATVRGGASGLIGPASARQGAFLRRPIATAGCPTTGSSET